MNKDKTSVTAEEELQEVSEQETLEDGVVSAQETPTEDVVDEEQVAQPAEDWKAKYEQAQRDLSRMKSSLQRGEAERLREKDGELSQIKEELEELRLLSLDDEDRTVYEQKKIKEDFRKAQDKIKQLENEREAIKQFYTYKDFFINRYGVPADKLIEDQGLEGLFSSGMNAVEEKLKALEAKAKAPQQTTMQKPKSKQPPETAKPSTGSIDRSLTLKKAIDKYAEGNTEAFWTGIASGSIPREVFDDIAKSLETEK